MHFSVIAKLVHQYKTLEVHTFHGLRNVELSYQSINTLTKKIV